MADGGLILLATAASIAFVHTILGPDHYLVFVAMGKARGWSLARTLRVTAMCGTGHVLSSVVIGAVGLMLGAQLAKLVAIESFRGEIAGWALFIVFVLGPCEALIPLLMYPAAQQSTVLVMSVALVFSVVTLATMLLGVAVTTLGLSQLKLNWNGRYAHAVAGASIALCGGAITFLGL